MLVSLAHSSPSPCPPWSAACSPTLPPSLSPPVQSQHGPALPGRSGPEIIIIWLLLTWGQWRDQAYGTSPQTVGWFFMTPNMGLLPRAVGWVGADAVVENKGSLLLPTRPPPGGGLDLQGLDLQHAVVAVPANAVGPVAEGCVVDDPCNGGTSGMHGTADISHFCGGVVDRYSSS